MGDLSLELLRKSSDRCLAESCDLIATTKVGIKMGKILVQVSQERIAETIAVNEEADWLLR